MKHPFRWNFIDPSHNYHNRKMNIIPIPCLKDNFVYLLICIQTRLAAVIDPSESEPILKELKNHNADLICILNTHHHWDHVGGNENILDEF
ncbi:uncharacterized protein METZ01_LOCUS384351, partial [marine metagenome]